MLTPAVTEAQHQLEEARDPLGDRLQCLRCGHEFKPGDSRLRLDSKESWRPLFQNTGASPALDLLACVLPAISGKMASREGVRRAAPGKNGVGTNFLPRGKIKPSACYTYKKSKRRRNYILFLFSL